MKEPESVRPPDGQTRRKAATRRVIMTTADRLFTEAGYAETTMEAIATAAGVAVRTLYLHFDSKSAILLAHFDVWLEAFVTAICDRPTEEPIEDSIAAALERLVSDGLEDRSYGQMAQPHPTVQFIGDGPPEIAGHLLQAWVGAQERLAADYAERSGVGLDTATPWSRAASVFAAWTSTILYARAGYARGDLPPAESGNSLGVKIARGMSRGPNAT